MVRPHGQRLLQAPVQDHRVPRATESLDETDGHPRPLRHNRTLAPASCHQHQHQIISLGVDTPFVSVGRDTTCSVRLYYPAVAPLHARVVFNDDRKAFMEALDAGGVHILSTRLPVEAFRFMCLPKEMRAALATSPDRAPASRPLRLSMTTSAQVFSPQPSHDPRQNLRVLQSPLRLASPSKFPRKKSKFSSPMKSSTPRGRGASATPTDPDDEGDSGGKDSDGKTVALLQGAHPRRRGGEGFDHIEGSCQEQLRPRLGFRGVTPRTVPSAVVFDSTAPQPSASRAVWIVHLLACGVCNDLATLFGFRVVVDSAAGVHVHA
ncbi:hypothetical protein B0H19DRAFT_1383281 [Mycena capillaripes]|nr:hypothetical protein B0H19DRAFT_1383281 [Mycena capillaripes]